MLLLDRIKKNKDKFCHSSPVLDIVYLEGRVYAALGSGEIYIYSRDTSKGLNNEF